MKVLITIEGPFVPSAVQGITTELKNAGHEVVLLEKYTEKAELLEAIKNVDTVIIRSDKVTSEVLDAAKRLKIAVRIGTGYDPIDTVYAKEKNVVIEDTPGQNSNAVAGLVFGLLVHVVRSFYNDKAGTGLMGKKVGIFAFDNVGCSITCVAKDLGMEVHAYNAFCPAGAIEAAGVHACKIQDELSQTCDALSLHIPTAPQTVKNIGYRLVNLLPKKGVLIDTARREVTSEEEPLKLMAECGDLKFATNIMPDVDAEFKEFEGCYFSTPEKMGAQTVKANNGAGIVTAKQISAFFATGGTKFQVSK